MAAFNLENLLSKLTPEEILKRTTEEILWTRYLGHCKLNKLIKVPPCLREGKTDDTPSGTLFLSNRGQIVLHDHSRKKTYNIFVYLRHLYNNCNFNDVLKIVNQDLQLGIGELKQNNTHKMVIVPNKIVEQEEKRTFKTKTSFFWEAFALDKFSLDAIKYWNSYGITKETLDFFDVVQIKGFISQTWNPIEEKFIPSIVKFKENELAFLYQFTEYHKNKELSRKNDYVSCKLYMPESTNKWLTNTTKYSIGGLKQLNVLESAFNKVTVHSNIDRYMIPDFSEERYEYYKITQEILNTPLSHQLYNPLFMDLVVTKSMKDVMVWYELGVPAICTQAEYNIFPMPDLLQELKDWFENIHLNYDNDLTGINASIQMIKNHSQFSKNPIFVDEFKDISGLVKNKSLDYAKKTISFLNAL